MMKRLSLVIFLPLFFYGMPFLATINAAESIQVFVSILPQKYFVEKIGRKRVVVSVMVKPGANPATYEPKPSQMKALSMAKIYFAIGVPFEKAWLKKIATTNPNMVVVHTEQGIEKRTMRTQHRHKSGKAFKDHHEIKDPHIWLSPALVILQARNILEAMSNLDPIYAHIYRSNYKKFAEEIIQLDTEIMNLFSKKGDKVEFMVFHPAWGYFAQAYGLEQIPVEIEGKKPKPADLRHLIKHAKEKDIRAIFVQPQFSAQSARTIAKAIEAEIVFSDPLALNWADNLQRVAEKFSEALR
ncbi:MAG: zinc ABC transporter substrate-binding protein [Thermodesulfobacteriota bacterium]|nr:zinc ABC transporter substrate-binding protein [Thermodesulfobacteriota bacterium]